jgi:ABC-type transport system involved in cytochrome bd biosynthesis fused ATPase/permease subunit
LPQDAENCFLPYKRQKLIESEFADLYRITLLFLWMRFLGWVYKYTGNKSASVAAKVWRSDAGWFYLFRYGMDGNGISQGQRQRLLIARAVYKNPAFLFFDEATNSLDANNERIIMDKLSDFYKGKTVVVVAHRLSTVKNADNIIVLDKGKIVEEGTHEELTPMKGAYYTLVKNQLELGN